MTGCCCCCKHPNPSILHPQKSPTIRLLGRLSEFLSGCRDEQPPIPGVVSFINGRLTMVNNGYEAVARRICWLTFPYPFLTVHLCFLYASSCPRWLGSARWSSPRSSQRACVPAGGPRRQRRPSGRCVTRRGSVPMQRDSYLDLKMVQTADPFLVIWDPIRPLEWGVRLRFCLLKLPYSLGQKKS